VIRTSSPDNATHQALPTDDAIKVIDTVIGRLEWAVGSQARRAVEVAPRSPVCGGSALSIEAEGRGMTERRFPPPWTVELGRP
jgi:hypothetical protein